jgi:hypothetical protein
MNGFEAVSHVRQGPADDDAHGIVHIGLFHLIFDIDRDMPEGRIIHEGT